MLTSIAHCIILQYCDIWVFHTGDADSDLLRCYVMPAPWNTTEGLSLLEPEGSEQLVRPKASIYINNIIWEGVEWI
jgi:hypothetical protein